MLRLIIILLGLAAACGTRSEVTQERQPLESPTPSPVSIEKREMKVDAALQAEFAKIAAAAKGKVGVAAVLIETGDAAFLNANERFPMQSVYKLPIAMALMDRVQNGELSLDQKVAVTKEDFVRKGMASPLRDKNPNGGAFAIRELIHLSLVDSDGTASDVQLRLLGGADKAQAYLTEIGVSDLKVVNTEKEIALDWQTQYENWATPNASVQLLRFLWASYLAEWKADAGPQELSDPNLTGAPVIIKFLNESVTGPQRLRGLLPKGGLMVAHKTGTGGTKDGITSATNDIGLITIAEGKTVAIAVFVSDSPASEAVREQVIAKIAKAVEDKWQAAQ